MRKETDVTLHVVREEPAGSFYYEKLEQLNPQNVPRLIEIGYQAGSEEFVIRTRQNTIERGKIETICRQFFEEVIERHFHN
jgi:hypothetical protein